MIKIKPESKIKTIEFITKLADKAAVDQYVGSLEYVPFLYISKLSDTEVPPIKGNTIDARNVIYVKLYNNRFLPEIELYCYDTIGNLFSDLFPFDHNSILSIFVKSSSEVPFPIRMDFRISEFEVTCSNKSDKKYLIKGILDLDDLHYTRYSATKGTSFNVLKEVALGMNLGWATNITNTNDEMVWINPSETYMNFIINTTKRSYVDDKSFNWSFIDFQYNLNFINVNLELLDIEKNELDTTANSKIIKNPGEDTTNLYLTNNAALQTTSKYIDKYSIINQSYKVNLQKSYRMKTTWYDKHENKTYRQFLNDIETEDKDQEPKKLINLYDYESPIYLENINDEHYSGKIDTDNVYKNYAISKAINEFNLQNIEKMKMVVILKQINFNIKRFQTIRVEIYNINDMLSKDAGTKNATDNINKHLSGFWLVTGINYIYKRVGGTEQELTLVRRDLDINYTTLNDFRKISADILKNKKSDGNTSIPTQPQGTKSVGLGSSARSVNNNF